MQGTVVVIVELARVSSLSTLWTLNSGLTTASAINPAPAATAKKRESQPGRVESATGLLSVHI
jgi:hypothetical protein